MSQGPDRLMDYNVLVSIDIHPIVLPAGAIMCSVACLICEVPVGDDPVRVVTLLPAYSAACRHGRVNSFTFLMHDRHDEPTPDAAINLALRSLDKCRDALEAG